jgi:hypothetical protein
MAGMTPEKLNAYVENFYKNKPKKDHYSGPIPVSFEMTQKSHVAIKSMFDICQQKFNSMETKDPNVFKRTRMTLFQSLKPFQNELNDCIWASNNIQEGEACAERFIQRVTTEGYHFATELAKKI